METAWKHCDVVVEGRADTGGQEHLYLETQCALALPGEGSALKVISATQGPTAVQIGVARVLGLPRHLVEVEVLRLGGGFGGKEDQATPWACMAALAAFRLGVPVKLALRRQEDLRLTGKRHPYSSDFRLGAAYDGRILAYEATLYQNAGCTADLSTAILERSLFHATGSYFIPNVRVTAASCRTNLPSNTAFRGFGGPQAMFVIEAAIARLAETLGVEASVVQEKNLLSEGDALPYGQQIRGGSARRCWNLARTRYRLEERRWQVAEFNRTHPLARKGLALMPVCFGISFTNQTLNQAGALVHVYTDGSVSLSTAAVEMGQGVHRKLREVVARAFSIDGQRVHVEATSTARVANTSPTAASTGTDLNGRAAELACRAVLERLREAAALELGKDRPEQVEIREEQVLYGGRPTSLTWAKLVPAAYRAPGEPFRSGPLRHPGHPLRPHRRKGGALRLPRLRHRDLRGDAGLPARHVSRGLGARPFTTWDPASTPPPTAARPREASCRASAGSPWRRSCTPRMGACSPRNWPRTRSRTCTSRPARWRCISWRTPPARWECSTPRRSASRP